MMSEIKLELCLFCGSEAFIEEYKHKNSMFPTFYIPKCHVCRAEINELFLTKEEAAKD